VDGALTEFAACYNRAKAGLRTAEHLRGVVSAAKLFFAHLEEIGVNWSTEQKVLGSFSEIMGFVPTDKILRQFADIFEEHGAVISTDEVRALMALSPQRASRGQQKVNETGIRRCQLEAIQFLSKRISQLRSQNTAAMLVSLSSSSPQASAEECAQMPLVIDAILLSAAANALGCVLSCAPCCVIAAAEYALAALLQLEKDAACSGLMD
jgi:hypothetical protein